MGVYNPDGSGNVDVPKKVVKRKKRASKVPKKKTRKVEQT